MKITGVGGGLKGTSARKWVAGALELRWSSAG
jgi:hypothetical protein